METIRVNMTPCEDIKTIHASQNDNEAREWGFELHNNGEKIDSSSITDQLVFKAYEGGTEQILPENGSTPTTSPFLGDIRYPQGLLSDQEFLYRESPTEEDGLAKITDIKGNTLVWNQLVPSASGWVSNNGTLSQSGNTYTYTVTALGDYDYQNRMQRAFPFVIPKGHKMFLSCEFYYPRNTPILIYMIRASASGVNRSVGGTTVANQWTRISGIIYETSTEFGFYQLALATIASNGYSVGDSVQVRNPMAIDLTMLFGEGNEPSTVEEFTSLFPLPYYAYNQGTLLSFNGNGIKTVSEDESEESTLSLPISTYFPNGMKSAGNVYDELTESKAITRIGSVDLGSLTWSYDSTYIRFGAITSGQIPNIKEYQSVRTQPFVCAIYMAIDDGRSISSVPDMSVYNDVNTNAIYIKNTSYTDVATFKNAMNGVYLYYELATPTETSFTTASLVTENTEVPLSVEDGKLNAKCTEQLSAEPGFHDAKIKLADGDGECYSNKIQLHVERKPS